MLLLLRCEICREDIGRFNPDKLELPLRGEMFEPLNPVQFLPPFMAGVAWVDLRCPLCKYRPFIKEDKVMTPEGLYTVGSGVYPGEETRPVQAIYDSVELDEEWSLRQAQEEARIRERAENMKENQCPYCEKYGYVSLLGLNNHIKKYHPGKELAYA